MAKKKRKTRKEKEVLKTHKFNQNKVLKPESVQSASEEIKAGGNNPLRKTKSNVPDFVIKDLKKVTVITGLIVAIVVILWILAYQTNVLDPLFQKINVKY